MANNIFDTRNIIKETPKVGNRFLLTADSTRLGTIVSGSPLFKLLQATSKDHINLAVKGNANAIDTDGSAYSTVLNLSLLSCTVPAFEFEAGELNHFNDSVKHLSKFSANNDMSATFYDYINGSSTTVMLAWQSMVGFKLTGEMGYKEDYVCDLDLYVYGPNRPGIVYNDDSADKNALMQYKILNAWPRSVDIGDFSYDGAEIKKVIVQFTYDIIVPYKIAAENDAGDGLKVYSLNNLSSNANSANSTTGAVSPGVSAADQNAFQTSEDLRGVTF
jgi:hypothetical protein